MELLKSFGNVGDTQTGVCLLQGISYSKTKMGSDMASFSVVIDGGQSLRGVTFSGDVVKVLKELNQESLLVEVRIQVDEYNGDKSIKLTGIFDAYDLTDEIALSIMDSIPAKPNVKRIGQYVREGMSSAGAKVVLNVLNDKAKELKVAMASQYGGYHDGKVGGLLNHIRKLLGYTELVMNEYVDTFSETERDLVYMGIIFHDIGKLLELHNGSYSEMSTSMPHTLIGVLILEEYKELITSSYNEQFYLDLLGIIGTHHGEYGERPVTVYAYLVHVIDMLDSRVSGLQKKLDENNESVQSLFFDDFRLNKHKFD